MRSANVGEADVIAGRTLSAIRRAAGSNGPRRRLVLTSWSTTADSGCGPRVTLVADTTTSSTATTYSLASADEDGASMNMRTGTGTGDWGAP
jgi:hypothetical protein